MDLQSAVVAMTGHVDNMSKAAVRAVAVATSGAVAAVASAGVRNDGRGVVVAFIAVAAIAFRIRRAGNAAARITIRRPAGIAAARSVRLEVVGAGFIVADMLTVVMVRTGPVAAPAATAAAAAAAAAAASVAAAAGRLSTAARVVAVAAAKESANRIDNTSERVADGATDIANRAADRFTS
jgi:hypothetical protein